MSYAKQKVDFNKSIEPPKDYISLREGENIVRVVSKDIYWIRKHTLREFGTFRSVLCEGQECQYCGKGNLASLRLLAIVLDRLTSNVGIVDLPKKIATKFLSLGLHDDIRTFDIMIMRKGKGKNTKYDKVEKLEPKEITEEEKIKIKEVMPILEKKYFSD